MNPFNAVWDTAALKVTLDQLSIMWLRSNGCIREFPDNSLSYMNDDTRTVICEFDLTPHQCNILKLRSAYYADIFSFMDTDFTKNVKITVDNPLFDATLVKHLILLNGRGKDELPDYKLVNVGQFVHICAYYSFDRMLDLMTGVHYFPEFFEAMVFNFRIYHPSIASLWRMFGTNRRRFYSMSISFPTIHTLHIKGRFWVGYCLNIKSYCLEWCVLSSSLHLLGWSRHFLCQVCELPLGHCELGDTSVTITSCCRVPSYHMSWLIFCVTHLVRCL